MVRTFRASRRGLAFVYSYDSKTPRVDPSCFVAPTATLVGDVSIGARSSVWYNCVLRGDVNAIRIGSTTNIQDGTVVHVRSSKLNERPMATCVGDYVTVGHSAVLHACTLHDLSFVGMQAVVMDFAVVEEEAMVAAGALVPSSAVVRSGELWIGRPAKMKRQLSHEERAFIRQSALAYADFADRHIHTAHPVVPDELRRS